MRSKTHQKISKIIKKNPELVERGLKLLNTNLVTPVGIMDALWEDNAGNIVVTEYKLIEKEDIAVGQIARYMGWVQQEHEGVPVRGIICCGESSKNLELAASIIPNVKVCELAFIKKLLREAPKSATYTGKAIFEDLSPPHTILSKVGRNGQVTVPHRIRKMLDIQHKDFVQYILVEVGRYRD